MDDALLTRVAEELDRALTGRRLHRVVQRGNGEILLDFKRRDGLWLRFSIDPANLSAHLGERPDRDSGPPQRTDSTFVALAKKHLEDTRLVAIEKVPGDRIVHLRFESDEESDAGTLVVSLAGRSADAFILGKIGQIASLRNRSHDPDSLVTPQPFRNSILLDDSRETNLPANETAAIRFREIEEQLSFVREQTRLRAQSEKNLKKMLTLKSNLEADRERFRASDSHQRFGELLLANLHQIRTEGDTFIVTDFFDPDGQETAIPTAGTGNARDAAEHYFKLARRARNGIKAIDERLEKLEREISAARDQLQSIIEARRLDDLPGAVRPRAIKGSSPAAKGTVKEKTARLPGIRRYNTSEGYEILVGRSDKDNDNLTFHIAKSHDLWFHAADYPGSHVVLRNPRRTALPQMAIQKAAQIAAKFSHAKNDSRVAVNYCERKFVSKLRKAPVGQVRLSSFKTILVEPGEPAERVY